MKVFISQPMKGKSNEEILSTRKAALEAVQEMYPEETITEIDSFFQNAPAEARPLWFLGKSLELLSTADVAVFCPGWNDFRGCRIEHDCCAEYGINMMELWPRVEDSTTKLITFP